MRHRLTVALYDESPLDAEILDHLAGYPQGKRQEIIRSICRAGFATLVQHKNASEAVIDSLDSDVSSMLIQILSNNTNSGINSRSVSMTERSQPRYQPNQSYKSSNLDTEPNVLNSKVDITKPQIEAPTEIRVEIENKEEQGLGNGLNQLDISDSSNTDIFKGDYYLEEPLISTSKTSKIDDLPESTSIETDNDFDDIEDPMSKLLLFIDDDL